MSLFGAVAVAVPVAIYDIVGTYYLWKDFDVVVNCKASNVDVHVIWPTNLWVYILLSVIITSLSTVALLLISIPQGLKAIKRFNKQRRRKGGYWDENQRYGLADDLPDWLFLMHGTALLFISMMHALLAFMGYFELFSARPWCEDKKTAFEELSLWHFGRVTFVLQIVFAALFFLWGTFYWAMPFFFEILEPDPAQVDTESQVRRSRRSNDRTRASER